MISLEVDNVNRFIGLAINGPETYALWKFCKHYSVKVGFDIHICMSVCESCLPERNFSDVN